MLTTSVVAQNLVAEQKKLPVHLEGLIVGAPNAVITITNQNIQRGRVPVATFGTDSSGVFNVDFEIPFGDYYYFKTINNQGISLILNGNDNIKIYADSKSLLFNCNIIGSPESDKMKEFYQNYLPFKQFEDSLKNVLKTVPGKQAEVNAAFEPKAKVFYGYRNGYIQTNTDFPSLFAVLSAVNQQTEYELYKQIIQRLKVTFPASPTIQAINKQLSVQENKEKAQEHISAGNPAPEIALPSPKGDTLKLSDLKGKVVLIDFWASWCGPCRKENPNVVNAYNKYNKDGFEVFSVSLDGDKARWEQAIKQDGLIWPYHVSDLAKWRSIAAKAYAVNSIPFTCLIDREGNVVQTNLRGPALEAKLKTIFGY